MRNILYAVISTILVLTATPSKAAERYVPLTRVAAQSGYVYSWLSAEGAASISRPGMVIVIRPGQNLYQVNDRIETTNSAPRFASHDIYVSRSLAQRIGELARQQTAVLPSQGAQSIKISSVPLQGAVTLDARPLAGSESLVLNGSAPPFLPVTITLLATISRDLPTVIVSRHYIQADAKGRFEATVPIASDYMRGSILKILASSVGAASSATAQVIIGAPNEGVSVPVEQSSGGVK
ncbi:MAG: stalk domain-containing protein [Candidatus Eremiobacteraeota bacterium]|nr:stalk domain-containing protein [Candidatus Eremiobacteraeota bacterium]